MIERFSTAPIPLAPGIQGGQFDRVDLVFTGVDHSRDSYEGRVYVTPSDSDQAAGIDVNTGRDHPAYAGSFHIFGHGGCFGDLGHCDIPSQPSAPFDHRPPHQLIPTTKLVVATQALKRIVGSAPPAAVTVTVIAITPGEASNEVLLFDEVRLLAYGGLAPALSSPA
jgi:tyrosinase